MIKKKKKKKDVIFTLGILQLGVNGFNLANNSAGNFMLKVTEKKEHWINIRNPVLNMFKLSSKDTISIDLFSVLYC